MPTYTNVADNPSLEGGTSGWNAGNSAWQQKTPANDGANVFPKDGVNSAGWGGTTGGDKWLAMGSSGHKPCAPGQQVAARISVTKFHLWPNNGLLGIRWIFFNSSGGVIFDNNGTTQRINANAPGDLIDFVTAPAGAASFECRANWYAGDSGASFEVRLDALVLIVAPAGSFTSLADVPLYFTGTLHVKTGGATSVARAGGPKVVISDVTITKTGGAVAVGRSGAAKAATMVKAGGGVAQAIAGGSKSMTWAKTGGAVAMARAGGPGQANILITKTGGAIAVASSGGNKTLAIAKTGGGVAVAVAGGGKAMAVAKTGGGVIGATAGGSKSVIQAKVGGGVSTARAGGTRYTIHTKTGGGIAVARAGGGKAAIQSRTGGATTVARAGGDKAIRYVKTGGAVATGRAGGAMVSFVQYTKTGGATAQARAGGSLVSFTFRFRVLPTGGSIRDVNHDGLVRVYVAGGEARYPARDGQTLSTPTTNTGGLVRSYSLTGVVRTYEGRGTIRDSELAGTVRNNMTGGVER